MQQPYSIKETLQEIKKQTCSVTETITAQELKEAQRETRLPRRSPANGGAPLLSMAHEGTKNPVIALPLPDVP